MARSFDPTGGADSITFAAGNAPPDQGPITLAFLAAAADNVGWTGYLARAFNGASPVWAALTSNNAGPKMFMEGDFGNGVAGRSTSYRWLVFTKASGSALPRIHVGDPTGTPSWTHTDNTFLTGDGSGPITSIVMGSGWRGPMMVAAGVDAVWTDGQIEARCTMAALDLFTAVSAATNKWMVRFNQASTATAVTDDTGGGGDQSALSGTTVVSDLAGFDYSISAGPSGPTATLWTGAAEVPVTTTLWTGAAEVPITLEVSP